MVYAFKKRQPLIVGIIFGLFAGGCGGLDPFLKSIGQNLGVSDESSVIPQSSIGWFFFLGSFFVATLAFTFTQWGFAKKAKASVLVPAYNCTYVVLPLVFAAGLYGFMFYWTTYVGVILIAVGIILMRAFKPEQTALHKTGSNEEVDKVQPIKSGNPSENKSI